MIKEVLSQYNVFIFDLDGTIVDSASINLLVLNKMKVARSQPLLTRKDVIDQISKGAECMAKKHFYGENIYKVVDEFRFLYKKQKTGKELIYKDVKKLLIKLKKDKKRMAICSNKPHLLCIKVLREIDIDRFFDLVLGGDSLTIKKPHQDMLISIVERLEADKQDCIFLGDSNIDAETAKLAKIDYIHHSLGYEELDCRFSGTPYYKYSSIYKAYIDSKSIN